MYRNDLRFGIYPVNRQEGRKLDILESYSVKAFKKLPTVHSDIDYICLTLLRISEGGANTVLLRSVGKLNKLMQ